MDFAFVIHGALLALGAIVLGLPPYLWHRSEKRRLAAIRLKLRAKAEAGIDPFDDGFYCILREGGSGSCGYISRQPAE